MLYLVRHAHAGPKQTWPGLDAARPLSGPGQQEAAGLVTTLQDHAITRILSSPATRCLQTVELLARQRRLAVELHDWLGVDADLADVMKFVEDSGAAAAVLCTHGELIGKVMEQLVVDGLRLPPAPRWAKGSTWVLDRDDHGHLSASYLPPSRGLLPTRR